MRLKAVGKRYGVRQPWVVRDVSADLPAGRLIRVEGRNGSGKSTLLRVVAGVTAASAGRVTGRPAHTGYVPERFPGGLPFSGREYLRHMARVHGLRGAAGVRAVDEWLERLGAAPYADQPLRSLSKGMCQKIAISQALLPRPGLLVLDEAWTGLDQAARGALDAAAMERAAAGGTVLFVDHDPARLAGHADERWRIEAGGRFSALPGDNAPGNNVAGDTVAGDTAAGTDVRIELAGVESGSLSALAGLAGVLGCAGPAGGVTAVRVAAGHSDDVLREVLAWDGVRVLSVRRESAGGR
jgi:ABC-2 type transport system ATP-binding protein